MSESLKSRVISHTNSLKLMSGRLSACLTRPDGHHDKHRRHSFIRGGGGDDQRGGS